MPKYLQSKDRRKLKERLCESQNWHCAYCGVTVSDDKEDIGKPFHATFDHVIPIAELVREAKFTRYSQRWYLRQCRPKEAWNYDCLVIACQSCNSKRTNTDAFVFYEGQLWKPENALVLKLWHMKRAFMSGGDVGTLRAMGNHCSCDLKLAA